jgi:hypothetical protein
MPIMSRPSSAPSTSLTYITIGAIMAVMAGTSYFFFDGSGSRLVGYVRTSFLLLGIVLMVIGFTVGHIGRAARESELPPPEVTPAVARESQAANARPAPAGPSAPQSTSNPGIPATNSVIQA